MCYSAQVEAAYEKYVRAWGADVDFEEFERLYFGNTLNALRTPKAMDAAFSQPTMPVQIREAIAARNAEQATKLEQDIFKQRKRLADAERTLQTKTTKKALEDQRIATDKVAWGLGKLSDLKRTELVPEDSRVYPGWYAPLMVMENGRRIIKPMRYQCRPAGKPAFYDVKYPGTYNARRDNLEGFWKDLFGYRHGILIVDSFFENVSLHRVQRRELAPGEKEQNVILEFKPQQPQQMLAACLWSHWRGKDEPDLLSFAAITDDPPEEIAIAGHDRCIIPIKPEHVDAWLNPDPGNLKAAYTILDERSRPYYEYRMAA